MRNAFIAVLAVLGLAQAAPAPAETEPATALVGATVVDGNGGAPIPDAVVILRGDRIEAVGPRSGIRIPRNARTVDVTGKFITPGLIDAHVHFFQSGSIYTRPDGVDLTAAVHAQDVARSKARLQETFDRYLASGVTSVVDAGGPLWNYEVRARAATGSRGPRVAVAGPLIATEPTEPQKKLIVDGDAPIISAATPEEAAALARAQLAHKPDLIKIWGIGQGADGARRVREMTAAVAAVAHPAGVRVAVHATELEVARAAVEGGADILVHSVEDKPVDDAFIALLKARGVIYTTTAMVFEGYRDVFSGRADLSPIERRLGDPEIIATLDEMPPAIVAAVKGQIPDNAAMIAANLRRVSAAGVRVAAGTDAGNPGTLHGPAIHRELEILVAAGLTPLQALTAATRDAAFVFSPRPDIGLVAPGYRADLLILDADPTKSVAALGRIVQVWSRGKPHDPAALIAASPEAVVQLQLERYNAHDLEGFIATYADEIEMFELPAKPIGTGKAKMREIYGALFRETPQLRCEIAQRTVEGPWIIDQEICRATPQAAPWRATAIYQVENGLIRRVWFADPRTQPAG